MAIKTVTEPERTPVGCQYCDCLRTLNEAENVGACPVFQRRGSLLRQKGLKKLRSQYVYLRMACSPRWMREQLGPEIKGL